MSLIQAGILGISRPSVGFTESNRGRIPLCCRDGLDPPRWFSRRGQLHRSV